MRLITCTGADHYPGYIARALHSLVAKSCFATANISERLSLVSLPVYYLDWSFSSDRLLPALLTSPAYWLFSLSAACLDPLLCLCLCLCLIYVVLDTAYDHCLSDFFYCVNKAANGSQRHWPFITTWFAKDINYLIMIWTIVCFSTLYLKWSFFKCTKLQLNHYNCVITNIIKSYPGFSRNDIKVYF